MLQLGLAKSTLLQTQWKLHVLGVTTYKGLHYGDGTSVRKLPALSTMVIAVDKAGNFLIADYSNPNELLVYSPCGDPSGKVRVISLAFV